MTRLPLSSEISRAQRRRDRLAADLAQADRELTALKEAQEKLREEPAEDQPLHRAHSVRTISRMQEHSLGVRIASGRRGQTESRKAQLQLGMTDQEVGDLVGVARSTVCKWHLGTSKIPDNARRRLAEIGIPERSWGQRSPGSA